jgi:hypothetical protein
VVCLRLTRSRRILNKVLMEPWAHRSLLSRSVKETCQSGLGGRDLAMKRVRSGKGEGPGRDSGRWQGCDNRSTRIQWTPARGEIKSHIPLSTSAMVRDVFAMPSSLDASRSTSLLCLRKNMLASSPRLVVTAGPTDCCVDCSCRRGGPAKVLSGREKAKEDVSG